MSHYVAFYLRLYCLPKYLFTVIQNGKDYGRGKTAISIERYKLGDSEFWIKTVIWSRDNTHYERNINKNASSKRIGPTIATCSPELSHYTNISKTNKIE